MGRPRRIHGARPAEHALRPGRDAGRPVALRFEMTRADQLLVQRGLAPSRSAAQRLIAELVAGRIDPQDGHVVVMP